MNVSPFDCLTGIVLLNSGSRMAASLIEWLTIVQLLSFPPVGEGSQCATMTASGAMIAAAVLCAAQNIAIAGVAAFASAVSSNKSVGR
jgi:hypothetical protein